MKKIALILILLLTNCAHHVMIRNYESGKLVVKSNVNLYESDVQEVQRLFKMAKIVFKKNYKYINDTKITVNYLTPDKFYEEEQDEGKESDHAFCKGNEVFIKVMQPIWGAPWINESASYLEPKSKDKQFLLLHELYHVWSVGRERYNEGEANLFPGDVGI